MANIAKFTDKDFRNEDNPVDFDLKKIYDMPTFEQQIFMWANFDRCRPQIIRYEEKRATPSHNTRHPKESKKEAIDLLRCHSKNLNFEPICNEPFNDARECLFKMEG